MFLKVKNESFLFVLCFAIDVLITFQFNYIKLSQNYILNPKRFLSAGKFKKNGPESTGLPHFSWSNRNLPERPELLGLKSQKRFIRIWFQNDIT